MWSRTGPGHLQKVPSQIAYKAENERLDRDTWGYEVPMGAKRYCWTKLLLDQRAEATRHDDPSLKLGSSTAGFPMPDGKVPSDVVADYLSHLYKHCMAYLEKKMTPQIFQVTAIEFWFTMPAIWSDEAQYATKAAAEQAGFGTSPTRLNDSINMITEPEAAALSSLKMSTDKFDDLLEVCCSNFQHKIKSQG